MSTARDVLQFKRHSEVNKVNNGLGTIGYQSRPMFFDHSQPPDEINPVSKKRSSFQYATIGLCQSTLSKVKEAKSWDEFIHNFISSMLHQQYVDKREIAMALRYSNFVVSR